MSLDKLSAADLGYYYACLLSEINDLYKRKKDFENEFVRRRKESIEKQDKERMENGD